MFKNYFKIGFRNLLKNKTFAFINISGLVIGITTCLLIGLYIHFEFSYDDHFEDADNLYRIAWWSDNPQTRTPHPMALAMVRDFPEVIDATSLSPIWGPGLTIPTFSVEYEDKRFDETGFFSADSTFFEIFSFDLELGDKTIALTQPGGVVITRKMADKYFISENPLGKTIRLNDRFDLEVTGVIQNVPKNTHFEFDFLISYVTLKQGETGEYYTWADFGHFNYLKLRDGTDIDELEAKLPAWSRQFIEWSDEDMSAFNRGSIGFYLQNVPDIHLHSNIRWELKANNSITYIYLFLGAAIFIMIIACINFINLSTARSLTRAKEVGLRKTIGALKSQLTFQFLVESIILCFLAVVISLFILELVFPAFNSFAGIEQNLPLHSPVFITSTILLTLLLGGLAGIYPAFILSKFQPTKVLKGTFSRSTDGLWVRKGLVILQFSVSTILIAGTLIIFQQLDFIKNKDLGFEREQIAVIPIRSAETRERFDALKDELLKIPSVNMVSASSNIPGGTFNQQDVQRNSNAPRIVMSELQADYDFFSTLGIEIAEGRSFSRDYSEDNGETFIINESAAAQLELDAPIGEEILFIDDENTITGNVVGVISDFHFQSLHEVIQPLIIQVRPDQYNYLYINFNSKNTNQLLAEIENIWYSFDPLFEFDYSFLSSEFEANYNREEKAGDLLLLFSLLSILIATMGLFGLTSFSVQSRIKEIGIRKILGANTRGIISLFTKDLLKLLSLSFLISIPITVFIMQLWLQDFAYKTPITPLVFLATILLVTITAQCSVTGITIKAALENPVNSLKSD